MEEIVTESGGYCCLLVVLTIHTGQATNDLQTWYRTSTGMPAAPSLEASGMIWLISSCIVDGNEEDLLVLFLALNVARP